MFLLLNLPLFASNEIMIRVISQGISFEFYGKDSIYNKGDFVNFRLVIHNNSDRKYFIFDPEANNFTPSYDSTMLRDKVFFNYGGAYQFDINANQRLKILNPGDSLSIPLILDTKILKLSGSFTNLFFTSINIGYLPYKEDLEYLTKSDDGLVYFRNNSNLMWAINSHKAILIGYLPILIRNN
jgi:hypothetical protein